MKSINEILSFSFSTDKFRSAALNIIPTTLKYQIANRIGEIHQISTKFGNADFEFSDNSLIDSVIKKFKTSLSRKDVEFTKRELRILAFGLDQGKGIISNEKEVIYAISLFESKWSDRFINGLFIILLRNWGSTHKESLAKIEEVVLGKLELYQGKNATLITLKEKRRFFSSARKGDIILGTELALQNIPITNFSNFLSIQESRFSDPYFSKVILAFYERKRNDIPLFIDEIIVALKKHSSNVKGTNTNKILISKLVLQAATQQFASLQDKVKNIAFSLVGDPEKDWTSFENATETEKNEITQAKNILNEWIAKQFIDVFFKVCINDERRKKFWLNIASKTKLTFKVYGSLHTKNILKSDERIAEYVDERFKEVSSRKDVSAFILYIGEYMLIEFSNEGYACCAYKINSLNKPNLMYKLNSVDDLRNSSLPLAIQSDSNYYYTNEEGRLFHSENWEFKFNHWLNEKIFR